MKLTNFINLLATAIVVSAAAGVATGCQQEPVGPERLEGDIEIALQMEDLATKVDVDGNNGECTWTAGDKIGIWIANDSGGDGYQEATVNTGSNTVHLAMTPEMSLAGYAVSPLIMAAGSAAAPKVEYLATYSMSGLTLTSPAFSYVPMMAVNNAELLRFYHVGGLLRLILDNVPDGTVKITVTFEGMDQVTGTCNVTQPGTSKATTAFASAETDKNVVTFTNVTRSAETMYLNVPIPSIDFSALTAVRIECYNSGNTKIGTVSKGIIGSWGTIKHGYGRILAADFTADVLSGVRLSSTAAVTMWKSKTVQRTATALDTYGRTYSDVSMVWSTSDDTIASVDAASGLVTAVSAGGPVTITATATPNSGGTPYSEDYTVYVNAITAISVANSHKVAPGKTKAITATLTNSNNGTPTGVPADLVVSWTSSDTDKVTVSSATTTPVKVNATTMTASVVVTGVAEGSATLTVSVPGYGSVTDSDNTVTCGLVTDLTFPSNGEPYKFRGYYVHPGSLFWNGSAFSITSGDDPLELLQHYWYDSQNTKFDGSSGTAWVNACYFTWTQLDERLGGSAGTTITGTVSANHPGTSTSYPWRIPTLGSSTGEWYTIYNSNPTYGIKVNNLNSGNAYTDNTANLIYVNVSLADAPAAYKNKGLGYYGDYTLSAAGAKAYQAGILLVPDGAYLTCAGIKAVPGNSNNTTASGSSNVISYEDLETLTSKGCVFLPSTGIYDGSWYYGGYCGFYWSASPNSSNAYTLRISDSSIDVTNFNKTNNYFPVRLVRN